MQSGERFKAGRRRVRGNQRIKISTIALALIFLTGLFLVLYPVGSNLWNTRRQAGAVSEYADQVAALNPDRYDRLREAAVSYNRALANRKNRFVMGPEERQEYESLLNISGNGIIGYIEIEKLGCFLPIYHGTEDAVIKRAAGHLEGSSLPVGGESTHCVILSHRGLPGARLFTDLDQLEEGDTFVLRVLEEALTYEVDQILVVEPDELSALAIEEGKDYCTLLTCTPLGINTHRLLVRGHRAEVPETAGTPYITADAVQIEPARAVLCAAAPILLILIVLRLLRRRRRG